MNARSRFIRAGVLVLVTVALGACGSDDASPTQPGNRAPEPIELIAPADGATDFARNGTLAWQAASDPDGDAVTYDVLLDTTPAPSTPLVTGQTATTFELDGSLERGTLYYWRVVARDAGDATTEGPVWTFTSRENAPPAAFQTLSPADGSTGTDPQPTLTWEATTDPEGDPFVYDVYLDGSANPSTRIAADLTATSFTLAGPLDPEVEVRWKVVARDDQGGETATPVRTFATRAAIVATLTQDDPGFEDRAGHVTLVFDGKMWVIAGEACCGGRYADVWSSTDGETWTEVLSSAPFGGRTVAAATIHDDKMWILGGNRAYSTGNELSDVWWSDDGSTWNLATDDAAFGPRYGAQAMSIDGKLWILGGRDAPRTYGRRQLWSSPNGADWTLVAEDGPSLVTMIV